MIWNVIFVIGIIAAVIGALLLIRFDGEIKRIVVALILVVFGVAAAITGKIMRPKPTQEYVVIQINSEINGIKCVEKEKFNGRTYSSDEMVPEHTYIIIEPEYLNELSLGETITKAELDANKKN